MRIIFPILFLIFQLSYAKTAAENPVDTILHRAERFLRHSTPLVDVKKMVSVDRPCLLIISKNKLFASDPTYTGGKIDIRIRKKLSVVILPADGTTVAVDL